MPTNQLLRRQLVSIPAAAKYAACNPRTIRRRIADGSLSAYKAGPRLIRVDLNDVDAWLRPISAAGSGPSAA